MKLSTLDYSVLGAFDLNAQRSVKEVARVCRSKEHIVQHSLRKMIAAGVVVPSVLIDLGALGLMEYVVMFSVSGREGSVDRLRTFLSQSPMVAWSAEISGPQRFYVALTARSPRSARDWMHEAQRLSQVLFQKRSFAVMEGVNFFPRKYLATSGMKLAEPVSIYARRDEVEIDELDLKILKVIRHNRALSGSEVARMLKEPIPTINYRLRRLEENRVIAAHWLRINLEKIGRSYTKVVLTLPVYDDSYVKRLRMFCAQNRLVVTLSQCLGGWDFEIGIEVTGARDTLDFLDELTGAFPPGTLQVDGVLPVLKVIPGFQGVPVDVG